MKQTASLLALALLVGQPASAQEHIVGLGYTDFSEDIAQDAVTLTYDFNARPFVERRVRSHAFAASALVDTEGDIFLGAGLLTRWSFESNWFLDLQITPGLFDEGTDENDLGLTFEFRSLGAVGYRFDNGGAISLAITHISNASLGDENPGANAALLRYHFSF